MSQMDLEFNNAAAGERRREEAIDRVELNAVPDFLDAALACVRYLVLRGGVFTADDVWRQLKERGVPAPREPRAMGAVMRAAAAEGIVKPTDTWKLSTRPACHRRPLRVWRAA